MLCESRSLHGRVTRREAGFTLVELLVVIGVIAVLISILLPSLTKARESAQRVKCTSNIRQMALSLTMYANDNQQYMPPIRGTSYDYGGWLYVLAPYLNAVPPFDPAFAATPTTPWNATQLSPNSALYCPVPATGVYATNSGYTGKAGRWRYSMNHDLRFARKITQIKSASEAFAFTENGYYYDVIHPQALEYAFWGHPNGYTSGPAHGGKGIAIAYLDGHAEFWRGNPPRATYYTDRGYVWTHSTFWGWPYRTSPPYLGARKAIFRP